MVVVYSLGQVAATEVAKARTERTEDDFMLTNWSETDRIASDVWMRTNEVSQAE